MVLFLHLRILRMDPCTEQSIMKWDKSEEAVDGLRNLPNVIIPCIFKSLLQQILDMNFFIHQNVGTCQSCVREKNGMLHCFSLPSSQVHNSHHVSPWFKTCTASWYLSASKCNWARRNRPRTLCASKSNDVVISSNALSGLNNFLWQLPRFL